MKSHVIFALLAVCFFSGCMVSQNKEGVVKTSIKTQKSIESVIMSKTFEFVAMTAFPTGHAPKDLSGSGYSISFTPKEIISNLPFYGTGNSGMALSRDKGMRFKGTPENFTVEKTDRGFEIQANVTDKDDSFSISLTVSNSGYGTLNITSKNRSAISYYGEVK